MTQWGTGRKVLTGTVVAVALCAAAVAPSAGARGARKQAPVQELAVLQSTHRAVSSLGEKPFRVTMLPARAPITGARTVVPIVGHKTADDGTQWLRVMLPGRPNSSKGWIEARGTTTTATNWRIVAKTGARRVFVYRAGRRVRSFPAIVGKPSTPTPHGLFFVEESVRMRHGSAGAPYALATSARSNVLQEFEGGRGQIALHGVQNLSGKMGTAASHGCVRLPNRAITWMAARIGAGTPVALRP